MALDDEDITTTPVESEGPADGGANPTGHDGGADGGADAAPTAARVPAVTARPTAAVTVARTAVRTTVPTTVRTVGRTAAPTTAQTVAPTAAPTAAPVRAPRTVARTPSATTEEPTVPPEHGRQSGPLGLVPRPALSRCLDVSVDAFAATIWGRVPHVSRTPGFDDLFSAAAVDDLVAGRGLRTPFLRMAKQGGVLPASRFTAPAGVGAQIGDQADADKIHTELAGGATLVLQGLHRVWPPVRAFTQALVADLGHPVQVNAYVTPPASQGFAPHYDTHDVFVLQIAGAKAWQVHEPVVEHPTQPWEQHRAAVTSRAVEPPHLATTLQPGDSLYLPRGWLHAAESGTQTSVHLTVGIHSLTGRDVIDALVQASGDDELLRRNLPVGFGTDPHASAETLELVMKEALTRMQAVPVEDVLPRLARRFDTASRPEPVAPLEQLDTADRLTETTRLRLRQGLRATVELTGDRVVLRAGDRRLSAPATCHAALSAVAEGGSWSPADLPGLDAADAAVLLRRLLTEAIVVPLGA